MLIDYNLPGESIESIFYEKKICMHITFVGNNS